MLSRLKAFLTGAGSSTTAANKIDLSLAISALLLEAARSDGDFSRDERGFVFDILHQRFNMDKNDANQVLSEAEEAVKAELDLFPFTRRINETLKREEKCDLLQELWTVILSDGRLDPQEDYLVHKFQRLLNLSHEELIETKLLARKKLEE